MLDEAQEERIPTNLRTLLILEVLGQSAVPMSPTQMNAHLGLPKQTIHRLCATLVEEGFLTYTHDGKKLRPARRARMMASGILFSSRIHIARHQILENIAQVVGETVNFVVPASDGMSYLDRVETGWPFRVQLPIGTHVPFHCTASGKTFLASLVPKEREKFALALPLERKTENTITDMQKLLSELASIASQGYALDDEEFMDGMVALAVPISDDKKRFLAALAIHGPTMRISTEKLLSQRNVLLDASRQLSEILSEG